MEPLHEVGAYRIDREIGRGGMGVVYLAHDSRLDRPVAIKALPEHLAADTDRLARFEREARTLAQLNHPNVAGIHGVEHDGDHTYLVLEYVEGETLADRLDRGPLPIDEALETCIAIARGLEAAHDAGIVHRDLKPANIKLTPDGKVKVLDFGLAKATDATAGSSIITQTALTMSTPHSPTVPGAILGTAPYMSPEQARGRSVDKRSDVWSFGIILYECLTGVGPFVGETITDSIGAILHKDVDLGLLPPGTPGQVRHVLARCLQRDKANRLRDVGDARLELEDALRHPTLPGSVSGTPPARSGPLARLAWPIATLFAIGAAYAAWTAWHAPKPAKTPMRLEVELGAGVPIQTGAGPHFALSPDGTRLVFLAGDDKRKLFVRDIDKLEATPLDGTTGADDPFWSPDGEWIGFYQEGKLKKVSVTGGAPLTLCDAPGAHRGATWGDDGTIVFAPSTTTGLMRVLSSGGKAEELTKPDREKKERSHRWPFFLPGSKHILFTEQTQGNDFDDATIEALNMDTLERTVVHRGGAFPIYTSSGHLLFGSRGTLYAAPFDPKSLKLLAPPEPVLAGVTTEGSNGAAHFTVSDNGTLVYNSGDATSAYQCKLISLDREGNVTALDERVRGYATAAVSPDGTQLAIQLLPDGASTYDIWVYDIARHVPSRLTFSEGDEISPVWSPDGKWIAYAATGEGFSPNLFLQRADGAGEPKQITESLNAQIPTSWTAHGNILAFHENFGETSWDLMTLHMDDPDARPEVFVRTPFGEGVGVFSPDGKWLAYGSGESGRGEVYVRSFPGPGGRWQVSTEGGRHPIWSPDGSELYYVNDGALMSVPIAVQGDAIKVGNPTKLHDHAPVTGFSYPQISVMPDAKTFVALDSQDSQEDDDKTALTFVFNWFDELRRQVPR